MIRMGLPKASAGIWFPFSWRSPGPLQTHFHTNHCVEVNMKSTLRTKIAAAAMLLVPVGAMLAATPAAAAHRDGAYERGHGYGDKRDLRVDQHAPRIFDVTPEDGDRVGDRGWTRITARFHDSGTGVAAVWLRMDGRDVTSQARVDADDVRYAEDLRPGRHWAELVVRDRAGNTARRTWTFDVVDHGRYGHDNRPGAQPQRW
jgi:hypothetical protein